MAFTPVYYSQRDPAWKNDKLGFSNYTIGSDGCAITALAILAKGYGHATTPGKLNRDLKALGRGVGFIDAMVVWGGLSRIYRDIQFANLVLCRDHDAPLSDIDASIASGQPVLVEVDRSLASGLQTHWVVLYAKQGNDYLMLDPWPYPPDNKPTLLKPRYAHGRTAAQTITAVVWYRYTGAPTPPPPPVVETDLYLTPTKEASAGLSLRAQPTTDSERLAIEPFGTPLQVMEAESIALPKVGVFGQWIRVRDPQHREGYVAAWYVELVPSEPPPGGDEPPTPPGGSTLPSVQDLVDAVNRLRADHGLPHYQVHSVLENIAQQHAEYMASSGQITHLDANGRRPYQRALEAGYPLDGDLSQGGFMSENIQAGASLSVDGVIQAWLGDAPHSNTLLSDIYQHIGAGIASDGTLIYYCLDAAKPRETSGGGGTGGDNGGDSGGNDQPPANYTLDVWVSQTVGSSGLRMRDQPSLGGALVTVVKAGHPLRVLEDEEQARAKVGQNNQWLHVRNGSGQEGYVAAWLVTLEEGGGTPSTDGDDTPPPAGGDDNPPPEPQPTVTMQARVSQRASSSGLSVHQSPSLASRVISTLHRGQIVRIIEPAEQAAAKIGQNNQWLHILDARDVPGYVAAWLIDPLEETPPSPPTEPPPDNTPEITMTVQVSPRVSSAGLRVRAAPSPSARIISTVHRKQILSVIEPREEAQAKIGQSNQWLHILDSRGVPGYVAAWLVEIPDDASEPSPEQPPAGDNHLQVQVAASATGGLRMRQGPNTSSAILTVLRAGTRLKPLESDSIVRQKIGVRNQWLYVEEPAQGRHGYVAAWYVELVEGAPADSGNGDQPLTVYVSTLASNGLRLRGGPSTSTQVVGVLMPHTALTVIEPSNPTEAKARVGRYGQWFKVRTAAGQEGYVAAWYVTL